MYTGFTGQLADIIVVVFQGRGARTEPDKQGLQGVMDMGGGRQATYGSRPAETSWQRQGPTWISWERNDGLRYRINGYNVDLAALRRAAGALDRTSA